MANIKGSNKNDTLVGTAAGDRLQGLGGDDTLSGLGGNDLIEGGGGNDRLIGGEGSDTLDGGIGIDTADYSGWAGAIRYQATGYSTDTNDKAKVEEYSVLGALLGTDQLAYVENVVGSAGNDYLAMGGGRNSLWGGAGDDWMHGGNGDDRLYGGEGDDLIDAGGGWEVIDGGPGNDTVYWAYGTLSRVIVDLAAGTITYPGYEGADLLTSIENIRGNWGTKELYGNEVANIIQGSAGPDLIDGRGGNDVLVGDYGRLTEVPGASTIGDDDTIRGGDGDDVLSGDLGRNILTGGSGFDTFVIDINALATTITDFEDGIDTLALYGGLTIAGWSGLDSDGDGTIDAMLASLSNDTSLTLLGHVAVPASLADGSGLDLDATNFAIPELSAWSMAGGWAGDGTTA